MFPSPADGAASAVIDDRIWVWPPWAFVAFVLGLTSQLRLAAPPGVHLLIFVRSLRLPGPAYSPVQPFCVYMVVKPPYPVTVVGWRVLLASPCC